MSDVEDARRVADQLRVPHHVFNFGADFETHVVEPYVDAHTRGLTPNPCIECNRHLKFDKLLRRATALGFDLVATGHHAKVVDVAGMPHIARGADAAKDQSYVLHMLSPEQLGRIRLPLGEMTKPDVRGIAEAIDLRTADKPDSQDVCFISHTTGGRQRFLEERVALTPGRVVDTKGKEQGQVDAIELVTIGQRKGLGVSGMGDPKYAVDVDVAEATVTIGPRRDLLCDRTATSGLNWVAEPVDGQVLVQASAHGKAEPAAISTAGDVMWTRAHTRIAPGQSVVFYIDDHVVGSATAAP